MTQPVLKGLAAAAALLAVVKSAHAADPAGDAKQAEAHKAEVKADLHSATAKSDAEVDVSSAEKASEGSGVDSSGSLTAKLGGWSVTLYGFAALNVMHDSTQSFGTNVGNAMLQKRGTFRGNNDQLQYTVKDSRIGLKIGAPTYGRIRTSAVAEMDFGAQQPIEVTEQTSYTGSTMRLRQFYLKVETPVIDVIAGQLQDVFGWGGKGFYPNTLAFLGITGQVYHRQPQLRFSKTITSDTVEFEIAAAATRPVQKGGGLPEAQGGLRVALNRWSTVRAQGYAQPGIGALSLGVSGIGRRFEVAEFLEWPGGSKNATGWGVAVDGFIPIIPVTNLKDRSNALSITGEFSQGTGIADMYTDLTGGALFPTLTNPQDRQQPTNPPPVYTQNIDSGIVTFDADARLKTIDWQSFMVGFQYYLPVFSGRVWVSGNFSRVKSGNIVSLTPIPGRPFVYSQAQYYDGNLFVSLTDSLQAGYSFQTVEQTFGDNVKARNYRNEVALHFFF